MASVDHDGNLLFGLLALQNGLIDQGALFAAFAAWVRDKGRPLAEHLIELGHLDRPRRAAVEAIAGLHVQACGGDPTKSLAVLAVGRSTRESLARLGGSQVEATLGQVGSAEPSTREDVDDLDRTGAYFVGNATANGQRFRVLRLHARGGLGAVFVAVDGELNREVALKQILDEFADDPTSRHRFLVEAEITGGLEHPGIVPVYGLGTFAGGRPFYAMRFIRGNSLKDAIQQFHAADRPDRDQGERSLALRRLLGQFVDACNAVAYAHNRGVIHRDLKPANVMLGPYGETLVVDWGLAKVIGRPESAVAGGEATLRPSADSGLAATFPGSVIGTPAYMSPEQARGDVDRLSPATDVYSLGATLYQLLTGRGAFEQAEFPVMQARVIAGEFPPPRQSNPRVQPALEAVCLKAMALEPDDRYDSPRALADDLEHWLADEPVSAWHEPWAVRARRWLARHRTLVTSGAAAAAMGVAGLVLAIVIQQGANQALRTYNRNLLVANTREESARQVAQARYALARKAVEAYYTGASEDVLLKKPELEDLRKRLLETALEFYREMATTLPDSPDNDSATRDELAQAYFAVASITREIGSKEEALAAFQQVRRILQELLRKHPGDDRLRDRLARCLHLIADLSQATGRRAEAARGYHDALTLRQELLKKYPDDNDQRRLIAWAFHAIGTFERAENRPQEAMQYYRQALAHYDRIARHRPDDALNQASRAGALHDIGLLQARTDPAAALRSLAKAVEIRRRIVQEHPTEKLYQQYLAMSCNDLAGRLWAVRRYDEALRLYQEALALYEDLAGRNPTVNELRSFVGSTHYNIANTLFQMNRLDQAEQSSRRTLAIDEALVAANPTVVGYKGQLSATLYQLGITNVRLGRSDLAVSWYRKALPHQEAVLRSSPNSVEAKAALTLTYDALAASSKRPDGSIDGDGLRWSERAVKLADELLQSEPSSERWRRRLAECLDTDGKVKRRAGHAALAVASHEKSRSLWESIVHEHPDDLDAISTLGGTLNNLAMALMEQGRPADAFAAYREAIARQRVAFDKAPGVAVYRGYLSNHYGNLAYLERSRGRYAEAAAAALEWQRLWPTNPDQLFNVACALAWCAPLVAPGKASPSPSEENDRRRYADMAMQALRQAVACGKRDLALFQQDRALDPLRARPDFRELLMDVAFPSDPFAKGTRISR